MTKPGQTAAGADGKAGPLGARLSDIAHVLDKLSTLDADLANVHQLAEELGVLHTEYQARLFWLKQMTDEIDERAKQTEATASAARSHAEGAQALVVEAIEHHRVLVESTKQEMQLLDDRFQAWEGQSRQAADEWQAEVEERVESWRMRVDASLAEQTAEIGERVAAAVEVAQAGAQMAKQVADQQGVLERAVTGNIRAVQERVDHEKAERRQATQLLADQLDGLRRSIKWKVLPIGMLLVALVATGVLLMWLR